MERSELEDVAVAAVESLCRDRAVYEGISRWAAERLWLTTREVTRRAGRPVPVAVLRAAAKKGRIAERSVHNTSSFASNTLAAAFDAEMSLSEGERAERTAAAVTRLFENDMASRRDDPWYWPVDRKLAAVPQDGIRPAIEGGLLREADVRSLGKRLVPADRWDVWVTAYNDQQIREYAFKARMEALVERIDAAFPPVGRHHVMHLTSGQVEAIVALLDRSVPCPGGPGSSDSEDASADHATEATHVRHP